MSGIVHCDAGCGATVPIDTPAYLRWAVRIDPARRPSVLAAIVLGAQPPSEAVKDVCPVCDSDAYGVTPRPFVWAGNAAFRGLLFLLNTYVWARVAAWALYS